MFQWPWGQQNYVVLRRSWETGSWTSDVFIMSKESRRVIDSLVNKFERSFLNFLNYSGLDLSLNSSFVFRQAVKVCLILKAISTVFIILSQLRFHVALLTPAMTSRDSMFHFM